MEYHERPLPDEYAPEFAGYVARVPDEELVTLLDEQVLGTLARLERISPEHADFAYAPGKWTIKDVVGHISDTERVLSYRALRIARGDRTELPGFEQDAYVAGAAFGERSLEDLVAEFALVRQATVALFRGLQPEAWVRRGTASGHGVSVRALACIIAGHELHHRALLEERYLEAAPGSRV